MKTTPRNTRDLNRHFNGTIFVERNIEIGRLEIVRNPTGYFYAAGQANLDGKGWFPFVTSGVYVYRASDFDFKTWESEIREVVLAAVVR